MGNAENQASSPFPKIERVEVNPERLAAFGSERDYVGLGIDLMIEAGSYINIALNILGPDETWTRDQAAIGGNLVRLYKLFSAILDQTVQLRLETSFILARLAFETIVATRYLLQEYDPALVDRYVKHSLDHERRLLAKIDASIASRSGIVRPIEDRMKKSIARIFVSSNVKPEDLPERKERDWGGKNLFEKAEAIGLGEAYLGLFAGASQNVHGAWGDIYAHHVETIGDGRFKPDISWGQPRPQLLYSIAILGLDTAEDFALFMGGEEVADHLVPHLDDLRKRIVDADAGHEAYLAGKTWPAV